MKVYTVCTVICPECGMGMAFVPYDDEKTRFSHIWCISHECSYYHKLFKVADHPVIEIEEIEEIECR